MQRFTGMGRAIDLRFPSNRVVVVVTMAAALLGVATGENRISAAISLGGAAFLGWALAREIDPDRPVTASISAPIAAIVAWIDLGQSHPPVIGALYLTMAAARVLTRSTGTPPTNLDLAIHVLLVAWLAGTSLAWVAGVGFAVVVVLDTKLEPPAPPGHLWWGTAVGLIATVAAGVRWDPPLWTSPSLGEWIPMVMGITGTLFLLRPEHPRSVTDSGGQPIDPRRLQSARVVVVAIAVASALMGGAAGVAAVGAVWVVLAVGGVMRILDQSV